jgi:MFS family permease
VTAVLRLPAKLRPPALPREVYVLAAVAFAVAVGFGIVAPVIPVFAREFGVSRAAAGAVISAFAFMRLVSALGSGQLVDRLGERLVLAAGIGVVAVSSALAGLARSYWQLLVLRGVGGVGSAMFTVSAMSLALRVVGPDRRGQAAGLFQAGFLVGIIVGPVLGGLLAGFSLRVPFYVYAATLAVAGSIGAFFLRRTPLPDQAAEDGQPQRTSLGAALRQRAYLAALTSNLGTGWVLFGVRSSLLPLFVVEGLHREPVWTGAGFLISAGAQALTLLPAGRYVDTVGRRPGMVLGGALAAAAVGLLAVSPTAPAYLLAMVVFGVGAGFLGVAPSAVVGDVVAGRGGTVVAAYQMAADLGAVIGPLLSGWLADTRGYAAAWACAAAVLGAGALLALGAPETRHRAAASANGAGGTEGPVQVGDQVVDRLDADGEPDEVGRHLEGAAGGAGMGHPGWVLDQRLDAAERLAEDE